MLSRRSANHSSLLPCIDASPEVFAGLISQRNFQLALDTHTAEERLPLPELPVLWLALHKKTNPAFLNVLLGQNCSEKNRIEVS